MLPIIHQQLNYNLPPEGMMLEVMKLVCACEGQTLPTHADTHVCNLYLAEVRLQAFCRAAAG